MGSDDLQEQLVLADLVNRVLDRGVSVMGDVVISVAGVDLIHLGLRLDLAATETVRPTTVTPTRALSLRDGGGPTGEARGAGEGRGAGGAE